MRVKMKVKINMRTNDKRGEGPAAAPSAQAADQHVPTAVNGLHRVVRHSQYILIKKQERNIAGRFKGRQYLRKTYNKGFVRDTWGNGQCQNIPVHLPRQVW